MRVNSLLEVTQPAGSRRASLWPGGGRPLLPMPCLTENALPTYLLNTSTCVIFNNIQGAWEQEKYRTRSLLSQSPPPGWGAPGSTANIETLTRKAPLSRKDLSVLKFREETDQAGRSNQGGGCFILTGVGALILALTWVLSPGPLALT